MSTSNKYLRLKEILESNKQWPMRYMFKFIIPNRDGKVDLIKSHMPTHSTISYKHTPNLKYVSMTCVAYMPSADDIVNLTQKIEDIDGVMAL